MVKFSTENYNDNIKQLSIDKGLCNTCGAKFIKVRKRYGDGNFANFGSNIDFNSCECTICNNHAYDVKDLDKDKNELMKILDDTSNNNSSTQLRANTVDKVLSDLWHVLYAIGKYGNNRYGNYQFLISKYALKCTRCGYIKITDNNNLDEAKSLVCNKCKYRLVLKNNEKFDSIIDSMQSDITKCITYMTSQENKPEKEEVAEVETKEASGLTKMRLRFRKYNPNMDVLTAYTVNDLQKTLICCNICGTPAELSTHRMKELKTFECSGCKEQQSNLNYLGLYKRDLTNTTKNGLVCKGQTDNKVELMCKYCGTVYHNKDKVKFLMGKIGCNKKARCSSVEVFCPECMYGIELRNKDILNASAKDLVCPKCNASIYTDAHNEIISMDAKIEINEGLRYLSSQIKKPVKYDSGIARSADPVYRGTDGVDYYNCRCVSHNQSCVLNEDEIQFNPHKYCNNVHNIFIDELEFKNLKLNREASITERKDK